MPRVGVGGELGQAVYELANAQSVDKALPLGRADQLRETIRRGLAQEVKASGAGLVGARLLEGDGSVLDVASARASGLIAQYRSASPQEQSRLRAEWSQTIKNTELQTDKRVPYFLALASTRDLE